MRTSSLISLQNAIFNAYNTKINEKYLTSLLFTLLKLDLFTSHKSFDKMTGLDGHHICLSPSKSHLTGRSRLKWQYTTLFKRILTLSRRRTEAKPFSFKKRARQDFLQKALAFLSLVPLKIFLALYSKYDFITSCARKTPSMEAMTMQRAWIE